MTKASGTNVELALVLPLGVVVNQLLRTEAHLRLLNMKTLDLAGERAADNCAGPIALRLEQIHETLDSIRGLVADIEADLVGEPITTGEKVKPLRMKISKAKERALMKEFGLDETVL